MNSGTIKALPNLGFGGVVCTVVYRTFFTIQRTLKCLVLGFEQNPSALSRGPLKKILAL